VLQVHENNTVGFGETLAIKVNRVKAQENLPDFA
jgi:hypothetical protein